MSVNSPKPLPSSLKRRVVLDTITTRFLLLFVFLLVIPIFSLSSLTLPLIENQWNEQTQSHLKGAEDLVLNQLEQDAVTLQTLLQVTPTGTFNALCHSNATQHCWMLSTQTNQAQETVAGLTRAVSAEQLIVLKKVLLNNPKPREMFFLWQHQIYQAVVGKQGHHLFILGQPVLLSENTKQRLHHGLSIWLVQEGNSTASQNAQLLGSDTSQLDELSNLLKHLQPVVGVQDRQESEHFYRLSQQFLRDFRGNRIGRLVAVLPLNEQIQALNRYHGGIKFILVASLFFSVILAMLAARTITQPLLKLIDRVNAISQSGDLSEMIMVKGVHEINQLGQAFNRMIERLRAEYRMKDEFVATLTHDLKVPLLAEKQTLQYFQEKFYGPINPEQANVLAVLSSTNDSALRLVNGLLEVSRYEAGNVKLIFKTEDLVLLIQEAMAELKALAQEKQIHWTFENPLNEAVLVSLDRLEIKRVLFNLFNNALMNTPKQGQLVCRLATATTLGHKAIQHLTHFSHTSLQESISLENRIVVSIQDSGVGIANEDLPFLFKRFAANRGRNPMSMGLGLYNCYQVIQAHHGTIWIETTEGEGTAVNFVIPLVSKE